MKKRPPGACIATIACGSALTELATGMRLKEAKNLAESTALIALHSLSALLETVL
jgi:NifU-like protein involved in Fe-S cluster formation